MTSDDSKSGPFSLKRWSQRKLEASRQAPDPAPAAAGVPLPQPADVPANETVAPVADPAPLPPVESLTIDSDFRAFLAPKVDEGLKRRALRQLFRDPHFNVMDGLDTYIDDYSIPDPISPEIVREMVQGRYIFDPPRMRVNEDGIAEEVPVQEAGAAPPVASSAVPVPEAADAAPPVDPKPEPVVEASHEGTEPAPR
jgi:hypothetical protein